MEKVYSALGAGLLAIIILFIMSILGGTILYCIYPHIFALFPSGINGVLTKNLNWWDSVCVVWIFRILIKSSNTNTNKKD